MKYQNTYLQFSFLYKLFLTLLLGYFCILMLEITLQYIPYNTDVAFLRIKQDYIHSLHYRISFFVHVYSSIFVLLAGFTQFSDRILKKAKTLHKIAGRSYVFIVLLLSAPSGFVIGLYANGGLSSRISFGLLGVLWFTFTLIAFLKIRKGDVNGHISFMYRSYALALSAITLRAWKYLIVFLLHPHPMDAYKIVAWLGWIPNLFIAELIIRKRLMK
ncbi:MAG: DUF2306 domain-containing protein [Bacteroidota bacterium]|nr:DUF2306 domain-containing protein [Bacteroidota bacterium]